MAVIPAPRMRVPNQPTASTPTVPTYSPVPAPTIEAHATNPAIEQFNFGVPQPQQDRLNQTLKDINGPITVTPGVPAPTPTPTAAQPNPATPSPIPAPMSASQSFSPVPTPNVPGSSNTLNKSQLEADAAARMAKQHAGLAQARDLALSNLKNSYDHQNKLTNDNRSLENWKLDQSMDPTNGMTNYRRAMTDRNRSIEDTAYNNNYQSQVSAANQPLTDFERMAPEQQQALYDQLLRQERDYGLQEGALTGYLNDKRTLAGAAQDANFTGIYQGNPTMQMQNQNFNQGLAAQQFGLQSQGQAFNQGMQQQQFGLQSQGQAFNQGMQQQQYGLQDKQANWNAARQAGQDTGTIVQPTQNWGNLYNQNGPQNYQSVQDAIKNGMSQQQINNSAKQFATQMGYNYDKMSQDDKQAWAQISVSQQKMNWDQSPSNPQNVGKQYTPEAIVKDIQGMPDLWKNETEIDPTTDKSRNTGRKILADPAHAESIILNSGLSQEDQLKAYQKLFTPQQLKDMGLSGN